MKNRKTAMVISAMAIFILCIIAIGIGTFTYLKYKEYQLFLENDMYMDGTTFDVSGITIDVSGMTADEAYDKYINESKSEDLVTININGKVFEFPLDEYCEHSLDVQNFKQYVGTESFKDYVLGNASVYHLNDSYEYEGGIGKEVQDIITNGDYPYEESKDAYFDTNTMEVVPEIYGTQIISDGVMEAVDTSIANQLYHLSAGDKEHYIKPKVYENEIREKYAGVLDIMKWQASYSVSSHVIKLSDYKDAVTVHEDGSYDIDYSFLTNAVYEVSKTVDTTYESIDFKAKKDGNIKVKGGTYGPIMHNKKEIEFLKGKLKAGESVSDRVPVWKCKPLEDGKNPDDYIEVDISSQHVWHYAGGELCCESDCVTGDAKKKRDTPTGAYYVTEKIPGKYLTGEDYKTWVDRWMRLTNSGIGLHDAGWKKKFGGNIYKGNGSHGCINLPKKYAYSLYDEIDVGILVVVHK